MEVAVFGGGCFWCTEAVFRMLRGVKTVAPGYTGGTTSNPTYEQVSSGRSGHAEVIKIDYDPNQISFRNLLTVFFASHDSTTRNRQGNDVGTQYRSVIFFTTATQEKEAKQYIAEFSKMTDSKPVVTEVAPLSTFWPAEDYHQEYYAHHKDAPYCQLIINPKLEKVRTEFETLTASEDSA